MKKVILAALGVLFLGFAGSAQMMNKDSLALVTKINKDNEKLAKMQGNLEEKTREKGETATKAQQSASDNMTAANDLNGNPQDKKLARKADRAAGDARSDAKKARIASDNLDNLNKDIRDMTERIAKNQTKLNKFIQVQKNLDAAPVVVVPAMTKDSTGN